MSDPVRSAKSILNGMLFCVYSLSSVAFRALCAINSEMCIPAYRFARIACSGVSENI